MEHHPRGTGAAARPQHPRRGPLRAATVRGLRRTLGQLRRSRRRPLRRRRHALVLPRRRPGSRRDGRRDLRPTTQLAEIRGQCRAWPPSNDFAINGHENRISYIVGSGHSYRVLAKPGRPPAPPCWPKCRRCSTISSAPTNGTSGSRKSSAAKTATASVFCDSSPLPTAATRVRFVEPGQVATPPERSGDPSAALGIQTDPDNVETVRGYWIDGQLVDAGRHPTSQGQRQRQRAARPAALFPRPPQPPPRRQAAAQHERRGRNPIGHRLDPQAPGHQRHGPRPVRAEPGQRQHRQPGDRTDSQLPPLRAGDDPGRDGGDGIRVSGGGHRRHPLRRRAPGGAAPLPPGW